MKVPFDILQKREFKNLYSRALSKEIENVVGVNIEFPEPVCNDYVFNNTENREDFSDVLEEILNLPNVRQLMG